MKKFETATIEINGKKYTGQYSGLRTTLRAVDSSYIDGSSNTSSEKMADFLFKYVIVEPAGLSVDDFDNMEEFNEVVAFAKDVMSGDYFQQESNKGTAKGKGTK